MLNGSLLVASVASLLLGCGEASESDLVDTKSAAAKPGGGTNPPTYVPMSWSGHIASAPKPISSEIGCQTNDVEYEFNASGSLNPGESFTFTIMPTCAGWNEAPVVGVQLTWDAS